TSDRSVERLREEGLLEFAVHPDTLRSLDLASGVQTTSALEGRVDRVAVEVALRVRGEARDAQATAHGVVLIGGVVRVRHRERQRLPCGKTPGACWIEGAGAGGYRRRRQGLRAGKLRSEHGSRQTATRALTG